MHRLLAMRRRRVLAAFIALPAAALVVVLALAILGVGRDGDEPAQAAPATTTTATAHDAHPAAGSFEPDDTVLADCAADDWPCHEQAYGNMAFTAGPEAAVAAVEEALPTDAAVQGDCHRIVHTIGSAALVRFEGDVGEAFAHGTATCASGYYHGILERAFAGAASRDDAAQTAGGLCRGEKIEETEFLLYQCVHGLGHGLMIYSGYDLPWALSVCDGLRTDWDQTSCTGGVFMENISSSYGITSKWVREDDPIYPCPAMKQRHKLYCYLMVTSRVNQLNGFDWSATAKTCRTKAERDWVATCFESYGRDASGQSQQDPDEVARICLIPERERDVLSCLYGAARDLAYFDTTGERARALCSQVERRYQAECFFGIGTIMGGLYRSDPDRRAACDRLAPTGFRASCYSGAGLAT